MEDLPPEYVEHGLPLILLSGLAQVEPQASQTAGRQESGTRINAESSVCEAGQAAILSERLADWDGTSQPWNAVALPPAGLLKYRFKSVGRSFTLPPRKAAPLAQSPSTEQVPIRQTNELHSPLSPLSPGSPVHPDGIMTPLWFSKHQAQVPCLVLAFFDFTLEGGVKQDERTKADIIAARSALSRSGFRTRFAAVLVSNKSIVQSPEMDERFSSIRRATSLDAKTGLFFMPPMPSAGEVATFVQTLLTTLQPVCVEYYRELTKHARRKKARSAIPLSPTLPTHGTAQSLSAPGWNTRYELKQAVFAEARQEMDVAERHYAQALEDLCNEDGVFESMPSWSPRWDETRLLCDSMAARILRCHLWTGLTTTAAQFWYTYRARMKDLIDRKGKGTHTYGWRAWEARWARIMAQLIQLAELPVLDNISRSRGDAMSEFVDYVSYSKPDRTFAAVDGVPPTYLLHHPGYWHRLSVQFARARYESAISMPDEDRLPPGQSPASSVANRAQSYDTYLVPEPHEEYANAESKGLVESMQLAQITEEANQEFSNKGQQRMIQLLDLELAKNYLHAQQLELAYGVLLPLWQSCTWRHELWHNLFHDLISLLLRCAVAAKDIETVASLVWEHTALLPQGADLSTDTKQALIQLEAAEKPLVEFANDDRLSPLHISFTFDEVPAYATEHVRCQIRISNAVTSETEDIEVNQLEITFSDGQTVIVSNDHESDLQTPVQHVVPDDDNTSRTSLNLKGMQSRIIEFDLSFPESGPVSVKNIVLTAESEYFRVKQMIDDANLLQSSAFFSAYEDKLVSHDTRKEDTTLIEVLPKPPKISVRLLRSQKHYYVGESIRLGLELTNKEAHSVSGDISLSVTHSEDSKVPADLYKTNTEDEDDNGAVTSLEAGATHISDVVISSPHSVVEMSLAMNFTYKLDGGAQTILIKTYETTIALEALVETKWTFGTLVHEQPWPSYFDPLLLLSEEASGIPQRWQASATCQLPTTDVIDIHSFSLALSRPLEDATCEITPQTEQKEQESNIVRSFELVTTKKAAEDRRPIQLLLSASIEWSRRGDGAKQTTTIPVPKITLPTSEPRVLCTVSQDTGPADALLTYHLENPSTHFLTFALTMEASDDFAYDGVKYRTLSLAPMSRVAISYKVVLHASSGSDAAGRWIWPVLHVVDSYYQKTLRIQPAGPDVKLDAKNGIGVFVKAG